MMANLSSSENGNSNLKEFNNTKNEHSTGKGRGISNNSEISEEHVSDYSDALTFNRFKAIFRDPVLCYKPFNSDIPICDDDGKKKSVTDDFGTFSRGLYACSSLSTASNMSSSFDMSNMVSSLTDIEGISNGYNLKIDNLSTDMIGLDCLADVLAANSVDFSGKEQTKCAIGTPLTQTVSSEAVQNEQDTVTPIGAVDLGISCDFSERIEKLLERFLSGDDIVQDELVSICSTKFNVSDSFGLSSDVVTALLRFCLLKGQLYLAGQLLQIAWERGLELSVGNIVQVLVSLCTSDAVGLMRNILIKLSIYGHNYDEILPGFVNEICSSMSTRVFNNFLLIIEDADDHRYATKWYVSLVVKLIDLLVCELFKDSDNNSMVLNTSENVKIVNNEELRRISLRLSNLNVFYKTSQATKCEICLSLSLANSTEYDERLKQLLPNEDLRISFLEYVYKSHPLDYINAVVKLISLKCLKGLSFISALQFGHRLSQSEATVVKICIAAQQRLTCVIPDSLKRPEFGDYELLSCSGINRLVQVIGPNLQASLLCICATISVLGRELFTPLVEASLLVEDFVAVESISKYLIEFYGGTPSNLLIKVLQCRCLRGDFKAVLKELNHVERVDKDNVEKDCMNVLMANSKTMGRITQTKNTRLSDTSSSISSSSELFYFIVDFGLRVAISVTNFEAASEFCKFLKSNQKVSTELSTLLQQIPTMLDSHGKFDAFLTLCEKLCLDENSFAAVLDCCLRIKNPKRLLRLINRFRRLGLQPQLQTYGVIIRSLGCCGRINDCKQIWNELTIKRGYEPNEVTYGIMLDALVNNNRVDDAMALFQEMRSKGTVKLNTIMYTTLIKGFGQNRQLKKAMEIYSLMCKEQVARNTVTYNSIIDACARVGDMKGAASLLEEMLLNQIEPDLITFSTIIKGYCVQSNMDQSFQLLGIMYERGIMPDGILYNSLLEGCVKSGRLWLCEKLWERMQQHGIPPSNFTLTILIKMYGRSGQLDKVFELVGRLPVEYGFTINAHVYTCLMSACITNQRYSTVIEIYKCMKNAGVRPDAKTFETLLQGVTKGGLFLHAAEILNDLYNLDGKATTDCTVMQNVNIKILENLFSRVCQSNVDPTITTIYAHIINRLDELYGIRLGWCFK